MRNLVITLVATTALLAGFYLSARHFAEPGIAVAPESNGDLVGTKRPDFRLGSNTGQFVSASHYTGKTLLINFWATWCAPCCHEMPMLMDLQNKRGPSGLQIIGIALDDAQNARDFAQVYGITYPILIGAADVMNTSVEYGNVEGVLPYSVLVDKDGVIRWQHAGEIRPGEISRLLDLYL